MKARFILGLWLLIPIAVGSCFRPSYECSYCVTNCPSPLTCEGNFCVSKPGQMCSQDAAPDQTAAETAMDSQTKQDLADDSGASDSAQPDIEPDVPPTLLCNDRCCVGTSCLEFPPRLHNGLLLWADRTSLGPQGFPSPTWRDRSMAGNDISAADPTIAPTVQRDPVGPILELHDSRIQLATPAGPAFRMGTEDFTILILARCDPNGTAASLIEKVTNVRPRKGVVLYCNHSKPQTIPPTPEDPVNAVLWAVDEARQMSADASMVASSRSDLPGQLHLYGARRVAGTRMQLRVDGAVEGELPIAASLDLSDDAPFDVASRVPVTFFDGGVAAVVMVKGPMTDQEVTDLESFLIRNQGRDAPPL